ncbi:hypothetical protein HDV57DRAFT_417891 [Trichoderma longibrachiatum]
MLEVPTRVRIPRRKSPGHWHVQAQSTHCRCWPAVLPSSPVHVSESVSPGAATPRQKSSLSCCSETRPRLSSDWSVWPGPEARPKPAGTDGVTHWRRSIRQPGRDTAHTADKRAPGFLRAACRAPRTSSALLSQPESLQTARESRRYKRQHSHSLASPPIFDPTGTDPPP